MSAFAVIPVKSLLRSKTRLSGLLSLEERQTLTLTMLEDVLKAVVRSESVQKIAVVSSDSKIQEFVSSFGVTYLQERKTGLNQAVEQGIYWCIEDQARSVLILPADIPLIKPDDVDKITSLGFEETCIVVAPSKNGGTNALFQKPPNLIPPHFGPESVSKHLVEASKRGIAARVFDSLNVTMDIDRPEDLANLLEIEAQAMSHAFLKQIKLDDRLRKRQRG